MAEGTKAKSQADSELQARFGRSVRDYRWRLGFSQEELAWRASMHRTYLADIERGGRNISLSNIVRLVNALGVSLSEFFATVEGSPSPLPPTAPRRKRSAVAGGPARAKRRADPRRPRA